MPIFEPWDAPNHWRPSPLAAGPFAGLQGGAVASLLTAEVEAQAGIRNWGAAISSAAWFLRPTPIADLRSEIRVIADGGRVSVVDNTLWAVGEEAPCATVRMTLSPERAVDVPGFAEAGRTAADPTQYPLRALHLVTGRKWFMDAMEARLGDGVAWFRMHDSIIAGAGPLSSVLGPADWTHGIGRPVQNVVADPNPNLTVQLFRQPRLLGRRAGQGALAAGGGARGRQRHAAGRRRRDRPCLDVGGAGAAPQASHGSRLAGRAPRLNKPSYLGGFGGLLPSDGCAALADRL